MKSKDSQDLFQTDGNGHDTCAEDVIAKNIPDDQEDSIPSALTIEMESQSGSSTAALSENAVKVLQKRYLKKDHDGRVIENPEDMFRRVARFVASADKLYDKNAAVQETESVFFDMMVNLEFMPNSPTLMNAGRELGQLSACFVLPVEDSMESIFDAVKFTALIHKSGGGTGFSFSRIRPQNDIVCSTKGVASGPLSFMHVFDEATETVKQGGTRRGANMAILRVDHPDIMDFIHAKDQDDKLNNFNTSVAMTEAFWKALETDSEYDLVNPHDRQKTGSLRAKEVFDKIVSHAWKNGDPGMIFIDRINEFNPTPNLGEIESTNPCGEQPLLPFESCNLGSINLAKMVKKQNNKYEIDYKKMLRTVRQAVHFLDNIIDLNRFPLPQIETHTKTTRKIGLGVMGFADLLFMLEIPYHSDKAIQTAEDIMKFISEESRRKSRELAEKRGAFPAFDGSVYSRRKEPALRNATRTTIAPTGSISIIAGCSSGIEPLFALSFTRNVMDNDELPETHPMFCQKLKDLGLYSDDLIKQIAKTGSLHDIKEIPDRIKQVFVTSHDISPEWHIRMQAAFQKYTDNAVSKTVNFPNKATREDVANVYRMAHDMGCKGVTIYRDGSREVQVLNKGTTKENPKFSVAGRPRLLNGFTNKLNTGQGSLYVTINVDESSSPVEVFANIGKSGGDTAALSEAIGRLISIALQKGVRVEELSHTLIGITGSRPVWNDGILVKSVPDGIGQILLHQFGKKESSDKPGSHELNKPDSPSQQKILTGPECPDCGAVMAVESGCSLCHNCGYSHCG